MTTSPTLRVASMVKRTLDQNLAKISSPSSGLAQQRNLNHRWITDKTYVHHFPHLTLPRRQLAKTTPNQVPRLNAFSHPHSEISNATCFSMFLLPIKHVLGSLWIYCPWKYHGQVGRCHCVSRILFFFTQKSAPVFFLLRAQPRFPFLASTILNLSSHHTPLNCA